MKLIIAIVQDEDSARLVRALMDAGYGVTKLATTGGFLRSGNTTLLVGVEDERFDGAMEVIEKICKSRKQIATSPSPMSGATAFTCPTRSRSWSAVRQCSSSTWKSSSRSERARRGGGGWPPPAAFDRPSGGKAYGAI